jgi:ketosteroid isomerase-like protein
MTDRELAELLQRRYAEWWAALPAHDGATLERILSDDWTYVDQYGTCRDRQEYIGLVERAIQPGHSTVTIDLDARRLGSAAIATGRYDVRGVIDGHDVDIKLRYTSVWHEHDGEWQCHAQHTTEIRDAAW